MRSILKGKLGTFCLLAEFLYYTVTNGKATPDRIPKTVIFIDRVVTISNAAKFFHTCLVSATADSPPHERYTMDKNDTGVYVLDIV